MKADNTLQNTRFPFPVPFKNTPMVVCSMHSVHYDPPAALYAAQVSGVSTTSFLIAATYITNDRGRGGSGEVLGSGNEYDCIAVDAGPPGQTTVQAHMVGNATSKETA